MNDLEKSAMQGCYDECLKNIKDILEDNPKSLENLKALTGEDTATREIVRVNNKFDILVDSLVFRNVSAVEKLAYKESYKFAVHAMIKVWGEGK